MLEKEKKTKVRGDYKRTWISDEYTDLFRAKKQHASFNRGLGNYQRRYETSF